MKAILLMIGIFLILIISFMIIWFMTADRAGNAEAVLPENSIEFMEQTKIQSVVRCSFK